MSEAEKQEGQKTVVAFITGLLIGGLLVWVFSSSPANAPQTQSESDETTTEETASTEDSNNDQGASAVTSTREVVRDVTPVGDASLTVDDQKAGNVVTLGKVSYPSENGWIVVREYANNVPGRILGAARFSTADGLTPKEVSLLRSTVAGSSYQVVFYTEDGDKKFSTTGDTLVKGGETTFKAN